MQDQNTVSAAVAIQKNASAVLELFDLFDEFATDVSLEENGAWVVYRGATRFLIARANNEAYGKALTSVLEANSEALGRGDEASDALSKKLMREIMAETLLLGWENVKYKGQIDVPYSKETAVALLEHNDFRLWVKRQSEMRDRFKATLVEEAAKN